MTPWEIAKASEASQQRALMAWCNQVARYGVAAADDARSYSLADREQIPQAIRLQWKPLPIFKRIFAIHNQGHGDKIRGAKAKAEGVKPGVPDLFWPVQTKEYAGLFIEMKKVKYGTLSPAQIDWRQFLREQGYFFERANGWKMARQIMLDYYGA